MADARFQRFALINVQAGLWSSLSRSPTPKWQPSSVSPIAAVECTEGASIEKLAIAGCMEVPLAHLTAAAWVSELLYPLSRAF